MLKQRVCGVLGGLSYVSTADVSIELEEIFFQTYDFLLKKKYYNQMNHIVGQLLPGHGSRIHVVSLEIFEYVDLLNKNDWSAVTEYLLQGVYQLVQSEIDFLVIASNTGRHISFS